MKVIDQMGYEVVIPQQKLRIVSLVPSLTELLFDLGLEDEIVGITKFCIHPKAKVVDYTKIGGTKNFNFKKITSLHPNLNIGNKEENYQEGIEKLKLDYPVWMSDVNTLDDAYDMIQAIGKITGKNNEAEYLVSSIRSEFTDMQAQSLTATALYFIWKAPFIVVGSSTFITEMMKVAGFENLITEPRYPEINDRQIEALNPEVILLSSEPYPFKQEHVTYFQQKFPNSEVKIVDGEMFSWYGSRLKYAPDYFQKLNR
jgi:ABC-type Fe3+-hydroxamate transport system substrate-binding protein